MLALGIFLLTLALVIWQPRHFGIGWSALAGAVMALALGVVNWVDVATVWHIVWDATFTFVALIIISLILDRAGFFEWAALHMAQRGRGHGTRLYVLLIVLGAVVSALFANDGAALLLTPIVISVLMRLQFSPAAAMAFIIATGFVADTTSLPLIVSNLVNIVLANFFGISFVEYALVMVPVDLIALGASLAVLWLFFRRDLPRRYARTGLPAPQSAIVDQIVFRAAVPVLGVLLLGYFLTAPWHIPVSAVTASAALVLAGLAGRWWRGGRDAAIDLRSVLRRAPWQIVIFSLGMYVVVYGLGKAGLTALNAGALHWLAQQGNFLATLGTGFLAALTASVVNNMPSTLISALAIDHAQVPELTRQLMIHAAVVGNDLGPKLTPIGSLATLLWLHVLADKGYRITWGQYVRLGLLLTPPVLILTLMALAWWLPVVVR